jgi:UPF0716 protein FxsA
MPLLLIVMIIVVVEAAAFATVSDLVGAWPAVGGIALTTIGGIALLARQGRSAFRRLQEALRDERRQGTIGGDLWLALSAALFAFPGYASDLLGLLLLLPPVRVLLRELVLFRLVGMVGRTGMRGHSRVIIEGDWRDDTRPPPNLPRR